MKRDLRLACGTYGLDAQVLWIPRSAPGCDISAVVSQPHCWCSECWFSDTQEGSCGKSRELVCLLVRGHPDVLSL